MTGRNLVKRFGVVFLLTALASGAFAAGLDVVKGSAKCYEPNANELSEAVVTPHIPWAKPYAGGKIRILVIGAKRETIELAQRMDLDYTVLVTPGTRELGNDRTRFLGALIARGFTLKEKEEELSRKLDGDYDVILLMNSWKSLSIELQLKLLWKIRKGTGFIGASVGLEKCGYLWEAFKRHPVAFPDEIIAGVPSKALPPLRWNKKMDKSIVKTARLGKGRMLWLGYSVFKDKVHGLIPSCNAPETCLQNEYFYSMIIKCLQWAAGKEPKVRIEELTVKNVPGKPGEATLLVALKNADGKNEKATIDIIDRIDLSIESNRTLSKRTEKLDIGPGMTKKQFALNGMPGGRNFVDIAVRNEKGQVINWGTGFVDVPAVCGMKISAPESGKYGEPIRGELQFASPPGEGVRAEIRLVDNYGREIQRKSLDDIKGKSYIAFEMKVKQPLTQLLSVQAKLVKNGVLLEEKHLPYIVTEFNLFDNDDFHLVMFAGHFVLNEYDRAFRQHIKELKKLGADTHLVLQNFAKIHQMSKNLDQRLKCFDYKAMAFAMSNVWQIPYFYRFHFDPWYTKDVKIDSKVRIPCLTDPGYLAALDKFLLGSAKVWAKYSPAAYSLGDESNLAGFHTDICHSPTCLKAFRVWLKGLYPSLDELNKQWGTDYKNWDGVVPLTFKEAKSAGNPSSWVDHWRFMETNWVNFLKRNQTVISGVDPHCRIGLEGDMHSRYYYTGYDWWKLCKVLEFLGPYKITPSMDSFAKKGALVGTIFGAYSGSTEGMMKCEPWNMLFNGGNFILHYASRYSLKGDLVPTMNFKWGAESVREIKQGAGKALLTAQSEDDGIVILYSRPSIISEIFLPQITKAVESMTGVEQWLRDIQLSFKYISHEQLENGILEGKRYRMLVLPFTQAMSRRGGDAVKKFVANGGIVLTDMRPAIVDDHGRAYKSGLLDEVFGIKRDASGKVEKGATVSILDNGVISGFSGELNFNKADGQVRCAKGRAAGRAAEVPAVIVNQYEKGKGILLNFPFAQFTKQFETYTQYPSDQFLKAALAGAGIKAVVAVADKDGKDFVGVNSFFFKRGKVRYLGCLPYMQKLLKFNGMKPEPAKIKLNEKAHIYDVLDGKYLGYGDEINTEFTWIRPKLYSLLAHKTQPPDVEMNSDSIAPGKEVKVKVGIKGDGELGDHVLRVEIFYPDGKLYAPYCRNLLACGGKAEFSFNTALNDPAGKYKLVVKDVTTGQKSERAFSIK